MLLEVDGLSIDLPTPAGPRQVVRDASFALDEGGTLGVVGESGSGKTMTALALMGLLPEGARIASGAIWFNGENLALKSRKEIARYRGRRIGIILQDPMTSLNPLFRIGEQIAEVFKYHHRIGSRRERWRRAAGIMRQVRISAVERRKSGGSMPIRISFPAACASAFRLLSISAVIRIC